MNKKFIFTGPPNAGKTSLRLFFFEKTSPTEILLPKSIEPTRGVNWVSYKHSGHNLGVCDCSGQEIDQILKDSDLFSGSDAIIYQFDVSDLNVEERKKEYLDYLIQLIKIKKEVDEDFDIFILCHKIDLIKENKLETTKEDIINMIINKVMKEFGDDCGIIIRFTSLHANFTEYTHELLERIITYELAIV